MTDGLKVFRILHAGYLFESATTRLIFDPVFENPFSVNCYAFPAVAFDASAISNLQLDAIFISHFHDDHCSLESLNLLDRSTPIYFYCAFDEIVQMLLELGFQNVNTLQLNEAIVIGDLKITPRAALDIDVDCIFQIEAGTHKILNVVDSWIDDATLELLRVEGPWDLVLWPFQTLREIEAISPSRATPATGLIPPEWNVQLQALCPRVIVPSSCQFIFEEGSWLNRSFFPISYASFAHQLKGLLPASQTLRLNPGCSLHLLGTRCERSTSLDWVYPIGNQDCDYVYDASERVPSMREIAGSMDKLNTRDCERVDRFARVELLERFRSRGPTDDPFFRKPRVWWLAVYGNETTVQNFYYRIDRDQIETLVESTVESIVHSVVDSTSNDPADWKTEIIARKLLNALEEGESLSSLYVRVNEGICHPEALDVDVLQDPLIRSLYNGEIGSYQRAQLRRLRTTQGLAGH